MGHTRWGDAIRLPILHQWPEKNLYYYLTDCIYPNWASFVKMTAEGTSRKHKRYATAQDPILKDF